MNKYQALIEEKRTQAKEQIARASFTLKAKEGQDANELAIENERMKTTLLVLNQKLNAQQDYEEQILTIKNKNDEVESELK